VVPPVTPPVVPTTTYYFCCCGNLGGCQSVSTATEGEAYAIAGNVCDNAYGSGLCAFGTSPSTGCTCL
jgi:hypothetical protein